MDSEKKDYILQEAKAIIAECEREIEENSKSKIVQRKDKELERKFRNYKITLSSILLIETVICIIFYIK